MTLIITAATEADSAAILDLLERSDLPTLGVTDNIGAFVVARAPDVVVGTSAVETYEKYGLLRSVAVDPSQRGHGIAALLVEHLLARAARDGLTALYLLTTSAQKYFERHGFAVSSRTEAPPGIRDSWEFQTGCPTSAVFMRRVVQRLG